MTFYTSYGKRIFDFTTALTGLLLFGWLILLAAVIARRDTGLSGFFRHTRVGQHGRHFEILKIRTLRTKIASPKGVTTTAELQHVTGTGRFFRRTKIDELPQLWNVLKGDMSLVGPRPDVPEYAGNLEGEDRIILSVRPGITGPATLQYRDEEEQLLAQTDPVRYNDEVIWPEKVRLNKQYVADCSFRYDLGILIKTVLTVLKIGKN
ncbi:Sugar transferase involved in LPS biosynthesis (colanic, teichoic acid) [Cyclonatronum proteinivorum]|uniref:Sugar transferase involved in LPS biosynthesis (Colanic, teichoic acid) n=1 Tax=Cyclonatronum proteinivorum TaxID=1457365 RepID=A0A345UJL7_9BACT|nr:sugar transferase [Cyclonatronum proteinivorum]AXJ00669.1 Sugar transferase involved in LPS biosynthesis (colanic, teichoic acid) [Cyclonatronum proteinivorum]